MWNIFPIDRCRLPAEREKGRPAGLGPESAAFGKPAVAAPRRHCRTPEGRADKSGTRIAEAYTYASGENKDNER